MIWGTTIFGNIHLMVVSFFDFHPDPLGNDQVLTIIFFKVVGEKPPSSLVCPSLTPHTPAITVV